MYGTFGYKDSKFNTTDVEWIWGLIFRMAWKYENFITIGFGAFGGFGTVSFDYEDCSYTCNIETDMKLRYELGAEIILGYFSVYGAARNFRQYGGGIGLIFY